MGLFGKWIRKVEMPARIEPGRRVYSVGDIHGRLDLLNILLENIQSHAAQAPAAKNVLIFLGDYVDRGPDSKGVIERLQTLSIPGWEIVFLRGNHDQTMLDFIDDPLIYRSWRGFGAQETLMSYGVRPPLFDRDADFIAARDQFANACPMAHWRFLGRLKYFHVEGDYVFVHAGLRPGLTLTEQAHEDLLWIREDFLSHRQKFPKMVVHGHTPSPAPVRNSNRIGIDTGAHATHCLTAAILEGESCTFIDTLANTKQKNMESEPMTDIRIAQRA